MQKVIGKNWRTSLLGLATAIPLIIEGIAAKDFIKIAEAIGLILMGAAAKDSVVTGI